MKLNQISPEPRNLRKSITTELTMWSYLWALFLSSLLITVFLVNLVVKLLGKPFEI